MHCVTLRIHADYYLRVKDDRSLDYYRVISTHSHRLCNTERAIQHGGVIDNYIMLVRAIRILGVRGEYL